MRALVGGVSNGFATSSSTTNPFSNKSPRFTLAPFMHAAKKPFFTTMSNQSPLNAVNGTDLNQLHALTQVLNDGVLWFDVDFNAQKQKKTRFASRSNSNILTTQVGWNQRTTKNSGVSWGVSASWSHYNTKFLGHPTKASGDASSLYVSNCWTPSSNKAQWIRVANILGVTLVNGSMERTNTLLNKTVSSKNRSYGFNYNVDAFFPTLIPTCAHIHIRPHLGLGYTYMKTPRFCERGDPHVVVNSHTYFSRIVDAAIGLDIGRTFSFKNISVKPNFRYQYQMMRQLGKLHVDATLQRFPTAILPAPLQKNDASHVMNVSIDTIFSHRVKLRAFGGYQISSQKRRSITGGLMCFVPLHVAPKKSSTTTKYQFKD